MKQQWKVSLEEIAITITTDTTGADDQLIPTVHPAAHKVHPISPHPAIRVTVLSEKPCR